MSESTKKPVVIEKSLSEREVMILAEHEKTIVRDFAAFYRVGKALIEINNLRLYRTEEGRTFEQYCKKVLDISRRRAYQFIDGAAVYEVLQIAGGVEMCTNGTHLGDETDSSPVKLPLNERQVRPLIKFKDNPEQLKTVWNAAVNSSPRGKVSASYVNKVAKDYLGENIDKAVHKARENVNKKSSPAFSEAFDKFSNEILKERRAGFKTTSKGEIIKALDQLRAELAEGSEPIENAVFYGGSDDANKLERAGFSMFRMDRSSMSIKQRNENGGWVKYSGGFATLKEMQAAFKAVLLDDMHLVG